MGVCPQHDVLWDDLTVKEHLQFFAGLKGVPSEKVLVSCNQSAPCLFACVCVPFLVTCFACRGIRLCVCLCMCVCEPCLFACLYVSVCGVSTCVREYASVCGVINSCGMCEPCMLLIFCELYAHVTRLCVCVCMSRNCLHMYHVSICGMCVCTRFCMRCVHVFACLYAVYACVHVSICGVCMRARVCMWCAHVCPLYVCYCVCQ